MANIAAVFIALMALLLPGKAVNAQSGVDLVLVAALDVSSSVDENEYHIMREGLARALLSEEVQFAINSGRFRAIAFSVVQWSGYLEQSVKLKWRRLSSRAEIEQTASEVRNMRRRFFGGSTDIGGAISYSRAHMLASPFFAPRRVLDVAGDGTNNVNFPPNDERDITVKQGITINGLAITQRSNSLIDYYELNVIGGEGAFVESANGYNEFEAAMQRKLAREISAHHLF